MWNPFKKRTPENIIQNPPPSDAETPKALLNQDTDPIYVTHAQDPSLDEDEMVIHTFIDPNSISKETKK